MVSSKFAGHWAQLRAGPDEVGWALSELAAARQAAATADHADALLAAAQQQAGAGRPEAATLALGLLARWARLQPVPAPPPEAAVLHRDASLTTRWLAEEGVASPLSAAMVLLAGAVSRGPGPEGRLQLAAALEAALCRPGHAAPPTAADVGAGTLLLLTTILLEAPGAACRLLSALLQYLGRLDGSSSTALLAILDALAPMYGGLRSAAAAAVGAGHGPATVVSAALRPAYAVLRGAAPGAPVAQQAAAVLALCGLVEGLLRGAAGFAAVQTLAAEAEASLLAVCDAAAAQAAEAAGEPPSSSSMLLVNACTLATVQLQQAVRRPQMTVSLLHCHVLSLLHSTLSLQPLCSAAAAGASPQAASDLVRHQLSSSLGQHSAAVARSLAEHVGTADAGTRSWVLQQLAGAARQTHRLYAAYSLQTPAEWLQSADHLPVRQLLERNFLSSLLLLDSAWRAASAGLPSSALAADHSHAQAQMQAQVTAAVAAVLSDLQFCRLQVEQYPALLKAVLAALPGHPDAAGAVAACLPCYADVSRPCVSRGAAPVWAVDGVMAAKVQFLFTLLTTCCSALPEALVTDRLAPLVFLYLLHPHAPTSAAAHQLFCALITSLPGEQCEPLAPFYTRRSLEGCPGPTPVPQLHQGLAAIMQALPTASPVPLVCLKRVLERCQQLAGDPGQTALLAELLTAACQVLLAIPHMHLDAAVTLLDDCLDSLPPQTQNSLYPVLFDVIAHSDDCVRKPGLAAWYQQRLAATHASSRVMAEQRSLPFTSAG